MKNTFYFVIIAVFLFVIFYLGWKNFSGSKRQGTPSAVLKNQPSGFRRFLNSIFPNNRRSASSPVTTQIQDRLGPSEKPVPSGARTNLVAAPESLEPQLQRLEKNLATMISKEMNSVVSRLIEHKNREMEKANEALNRQVSKLEETVNSLSRDKDSFDRKLAEKDNEIAKVQGELKTKTAEIDFYLKDANRFKAIAPYGYDELAKTAKFSQQHLGFFQQLTVTEDSVKKLLSKSQRANAASLDTDFLKLMWSKYAEKKNEIQLAKWELLLKGIEHSGLITDQDVIPRLKTGKTNDTKWEILNELLEKEVYKRWLSAIMVLLEEVRNLDRFTNKAQTMIAEEARNFNVVLNDLKAQAIAALHLEVQYAPLFDDYTHYTKIIKIDAVGESVYPFYKELLKELHLEPNSIWQVVSYGMKSEYVVNNEPTKVILAK